MEKNEAVEIIKNGHIVEGFMAYAMAQGVTPKVLKIGIWVNQIDEHWILKCNGTENKIEPIPPFSWYVEFNGWPAGIFNLLGDGVICAGEAGNEENLRTAMLTSLNSPLMPNTAEYKNYLFVQVKSDGYDFEIDEHLFYKAYYMGMDSIGHMAELPPGSWQIIGKGDKITDTIWYGIVDKQDYRKGNYNDYWFKDYVSQEYSLQDATSSGYSLLRSLGMEPGTVLILKKNEV